MKLLWVCGTFNDKNGKSSSIGSTMYDTVKSLFETSTIINGGSWGLLELLAHIIPEYDVIAWLANVPNDKEKIVKNIKKINYKCVLITSKRNVEKKYSLQEVVAHGLSLKSNLILEIFKSGERYYGRVIDSLGNVFTSKSEDFKYLALAAINRAFEIKSFTRERSIKAGAKIDFEVEPKFLDIIHDAADTFRQLIYGVNTKRFLGNASFRCDKGFPSCRKGEYILVSKRNVDKSQITDDDFVLVRLRNSKDCYYLGDEKPSVDAPIQQKLYLYYAYADYMLHGHVYVKGAKKTSKIITCGALEEFDEIKKIYPNRRYVNFSVNLRGHGFIAVADNLDYFKKIKYQPRDLFENL